MPLNTEESKVTERQKRLITLFDILALKILQRKKRSSPW